MSKLYSYHFSFGNSTYGPIGYCASIKAHSAAEAVEILKEHIYLEVPVIDKYSHAGIEYAECYVNPEAITVDDIDEWEELDEDE